MSRLTDPAGTRRRPRPLGRLTAVFGAAALAATAAGLGSVPAHASPTAATTLVVNAAQTLRPVTHAASGGLYGLADASTPSDSLVAALKPNTFVQMAPGGAQLPNGEPRPGGDALVVASKAAKAGAKVVVRMPDWYPNFPYKWVSWSDWLSAVDKQTASVKASGAGNISAYELWNEPDWTWDTSAAGSWDDGWARTYKEVRAKDGSTPIQGPSISAWNQGSMSQFLTDAKASGTVPDIISWHELGGSQNIAAHVAAYRSLESSLGISARPISIEEYGTTAEVGVPGPLAGYVAKFERAGVHDAELAFWNHYGTLGDTLTDTGASPNGSYWLYKWYGDMSGNMLTTTPPSQTGLDGAASLSGDGKQVSVIFGGGSGSSAVTVRRSRLGLRQHGARQAGVHTVEGPHHGRLCAVHDLRDRLSGLERLRHGARDDERLGRLPPGHHPERQLDLTGGDLPAHQQEQRPRPGHPERGHRSGHRSRPGHGRHRQQPVVDPHDRGIRPLQDRQ